MHYAIKLLKCNDAGIMLSTPKSSPLPFIVILVHMHKAHILVQMRMITVINDACTANQCLLWEWASPEYLTRLI